MAAILSKVWWIKRLKHNSIVAGVAYIFPRSKSFTIFHNMLHLATLIVYVSGKAHRGCNGEYLVPS